MADKNLDELKGLDPVERLSRLKKIEKDQKVEIERAQKMINDSVAEIEETGKRLLDIPIPQMTALDLGSLTTIDEKMAFKTKRYATDKPNEESEEEAGMKAELEDRVRHEAGERTAKQLAGSVQYGEAIGDSKQLLYMAERLSEAYGTIKQLATQEYLSAKDQARLESYEEMAETLYKSRFSPTNAMQKDVITAAGRLLREALYKGEVD